MNLFIQIPCYNEEKNLPETISNLPKHIAGISNIEIVIINDGSTDNTKEVAKALGVKHVLDLCYNRGLSEAFGNGIQFCYDHGADIIVNTDADNQYCGADIEKLVKPILDGKAQMVIGNRETNNINHFSKIKKLLQKFGSFVVSFLANVKVPDAASGFRAFSRDLALHIFLFTKFSYTLETIIMCGQKKIPVVSVLIRTNPPTRKSRLFLSMPHYLFKSGLTLIRVYLLYASASLLINIGIISFLIGLIPCIRFLIISILYSSVGHIQSLILGSIFLVTGGLLLIAGLIVHNIQDNRKLIEAIFIKMRTSQK